METSKNNIVKLSLIQTGFSILIDGLLYPLDSIRSKIMNNPHEHLTVWRAFLKYKAEGWSTFYKGFPFVLPTNIIANFVWVYSYENLNKFQYKFINNHSHSENKKDVYKSLVPYFSSITSELISNLMCVPFDIVKVRMQVEGSTNIKYSKIFSAIRDIYSREGLWRFWSVSHISLTVSMFKTGIYMGNYENFRKYVLTRSKSTKLSVLYNTFCITLATIINSIIFNPVEVIMTRFQTTDSTKKAPKARLILKEILKNESFSALYKGFGGRIFIHIFGSVMWFTVYEHYRTKFGFAL